VVVVDRLVAGGPVRLELETLLTWRDVHGERGEWGPPPTVDHDSAGPVVEGRVRVRGPGWTPGGQWYRGVRARAEAERGLSATEDLWFAGTFGAHLDAPGDAVEVTASAGDSPEPGRATDIVARSSSSPAARRTRWTPGF
jgi:Glycogen debranching enzyme N terminal